MIQKSKILNLSVGADVANTQNDKPITTQIIDNNINLGQYQNLYYFIGGGQTYSSTDYDWRELIY